MTEYALADITNSPAGDFSVTLWSDLAGLTVPSTNTFTVIGDAEDTADYVPTQRKVRTLSVEVVDDTTTYAGGFWYKILTGGDVRLLFAIDESGTDVAYFIGQVNKWNANELYADGSAYVKTVEMQLVSLEEVMYAPASTFALLKAEILTNKILNTADTPTVGDPYSVIRLKNVFSCLLKSSGLNSTYSADDTTFYADTADMRFYRADIPGSTFDFGDLFVPLEALIQVGPLDWGETGMILDVPQNMSSMRNFIVALLDSFGLVMRMGYNVSTGRHTIALMHRGRVFPAADNIVESSLSESNITSNDAVSINGVRAYYFVTTTVDAWCAKNNSTIEFGTVPQWVEFESDVPTLFVVDGSGMDASFFPSFLEEGVDTFDLTYDQFCKSCDYYDYSTDAYVTPTDGQTQLQECVAGYIKGRFTYGFRVIERRYEDMVLALSSGSSSVANMVPLRRCSINDGVNTATYYANRVIKNPSDDSLTIEWIEE